MVGRKLKMKPRRVESEKRRKYYLKRFDKCGTT